MKPEPGRIVRFVRGGRAWAAVITHVWSDTCVNLFRFPDGSFGIGPDVDLTPMSVLWDGTGQNDYSWHWPPRQKTEHEFSVEAALRARTE